MDLELIEVSTGEVKTPEGESLQIHGGAYLPPDVYLRTNAELARLRQKQAEAAASNALPMVIVGASLVGFAVGFWLGSKSDED
jgi:hypothetical protein